MTEFRGVLSLQVDSILERLRQRKDTRCGELIRQAEAQARDLVLLVNEPPSRIRSTS